MNAARRSANAGLLRVRVLPRAAHEGLTRDPSGVVRAHLTAPPVDGAANRALVALLAERLGLPKRAFALIRGERGRDKTVAVEGVSPSQLEALVSRAVASSIDKAKGRGYF